MTVVGVAHAEGPPALWRDLAVGDAAKEVEKKLGTPLREESSSPLDGRPTGPGQRFMSFHLSTGDGAVVFFKDRLYQVMSVQRLKGIAPKEALDDVVKERGPAAAISELADGVLRATWQRSPIEDVVVLKPAADGVDAFAMATEKDIERAVKKAESDAAVVMECPDDGDSMMEEDPDEPIITGMPELPIHRQLLCGHEVRGKRVREGTAVAYDQYGLLIVVGAYKQDARTGAWTLTPSDGEIRRIEGSFEDDRRVGVWSSFDAAGNKLMVERYRLGLRDGAATEWYASGQKKAEATFKDGELVGTWTAWFAGGQKREEGHYAKGFARPPWNCWDEAGNETECEEEREFAAAEEVRAEVATALAELKAIKQGPALVADTAKWISAQCDVEQEAMAFKRSMRAECEEGPTVVVEETGQTCSRARVEYYGKQATRLRAQGERVRLAMVKVDARAQKGGVDLWQAFVAYASALRRCHCPDLRTEDVGVCRW
ncbi:MAG: hypothetical protein JNK64_22575 [Myxococcales bacterium]|nr:hypothetical protein [Myxococcales bacterium]